MIRDHSAIKYNKNALFYYKITLKVKLKSNCEPTTITNNLYFIKSSVKKNNNIELMTKIKEDNIKKSFALKTVTK